MMYMKTDDKQLERVRAWKKRNKGRVTDQDRRWRARYPDKVKKHSADRRARLRSARPGALSQISDPVFIGAWGEAKATVELLERGYQVSRPVSSGCPYDLIAERGGEMTRVQVKVFDRMTKTLFEKRIKKELGRCDLFVFVRWDGSVFVMTPEEVADGRGSCGVEHGGSKRRAESGEGSVRGRGRTHEQVGGASTPRSLWDLCTTTQVFREVTYTA